MSDDVKHVSGRKAWIQMCDVVLAKEDNVRRFAEALQNEVDESPMGVFTKIVMPLTPKQLEIETSAVSTEEVARQLKEMNETVPDAN